mmetsp:Transcript_24152/g.67823  ORF Transcript_24152/g.67823 Transcript_24152/m.67823 type:complete len:314 (+) Transcript_24152:175-1116(+)
MRATPCALLLGARRLARSQRSGRRLHCTRPTRTCECANIASCLMSQPCSCSHPGSNSWRTARSGSWRTEAWAKAFSATHEFRKPTASPHAASCTPRRLKRPMCPSSAACVSLENALASPASWPVLSWRSTTSSSFACSASYSGLFAKLPCVCAYAYATKHRSFAVHAGDSSRPLGGWAAASLAQSSPRRAPRNFPAALRPSSRERSTRKPPARCRIRESTSLEIDERKRCAQAKSFATSSAQARPSLQCWTAARPALSACSGKPMPLRLRRPPDEGDSLELAAAPPPAAAPSRALGRCLCRRPWDAAGIPSNG